MRSFAEEKRSGTYELLMTSPLGHRDRARSSSAPSASSSYAAADRHLSVDPGHHRRQPEMGVIFSGYLGLLLLATSSSRWGC
jgi:hypothetical protein